MKTPPASFAIIVLFAALIFAAGNSGASADDCTCRVADTATGICPLLNGEAVPSVTLSTIEGEPFDLAVETHKQPTVIIFYRGGWCGYCNRQLAGLQEIEDDLTALGYRIVAIAPNLPEKLTETIEKHTLTYTLLSDVDMKASNAFGLSFRLDDALQQRFDDRNTFTEYSGRPQTTLPVPAAFVVDTDGIIHFEYINPTYSVRVEPDVLLAAARAALDDE